MSDAASIPALEFPVVNVAQATFECIFGRGCDGVCCRNGRPPVTGEEAGRIDANIEKFLPALRPDARMIVEKYGYLSRRGNPDQPLMRVAGGWCVFFNQGCVLHKVGAEEGDKYFYKPAPCSLFPIAKDRKDRWQVRQKGYNREIWDLFCLDPDASNAPAAVSLQDEIALAQEISRKEQRRAVR